MPKQTIPQQLTTQNVGGFDKPAFSTLYINYNQAIFSVIIKFVRRKEVAEDLLQDVFIKVMRYMGSYNGDKGAMFTWMANIARNVCIDHLRSKHHRMAVYMPEEEFNSSYVISLLPNNRVGQDELYKITLSLDAKVRDVIQLVYFKEYTQEETAVALNIPIGTVKTRNRAGLKKLRQFYTNDSYVAKKLCAAT